MMIQLENGLSCMQLGAKTELDNIRFLFLSFRQIDKRMKDNSVQFSTRCYLYLHIGGVYFENKKYDSRRS